MKKLLVTSCRQRTWDSKNAGWYTFDLPCDGKIKDVMERKDPELVSVPAMQRIFGNLLDIEKQLFSAVPSSTEGVSKSQLGVRGYVTSNSGIDNREWKCLEIVS